MIPALVQQDASPLAPQSAMMVDHEYLPIDDIVPLCRRNPSLSNIQRENQMENHSKHGIATSVVAGLQPQDLNSHGNTHSGVSSWTTDSSTSKRKRLFQDDTYRVLDSSSPTPSRRRRRFTITTPRPDSTNHRHDPPMDCSSYQLPITLHKIMEEEYTLITKKGFHTDHCGTQPRPLRKLHHLPATVTIQHVLDHFQNKYLSQEDHDDDDKNHVQRFCLGLEQWCDSNLASLLFAEEMPQYHHYWMMTITHHPTQEQGQPNRPPQNLRVCQVYGCHILLRLIVNPPKSLAHLLCDSLLGDLIALLQKNRQVCFRRSYREPMAQELLDWEKTILVMDKPLSAWNAKDGTTSCSATPTVAREYTIHGQQRYDEEHQEMAMATTPPKKKRWDGTE